MRLQTALCEIMLHLKSVPVYADAPNIYAHHSIIILVGALCKRAYGGSFMYFRFRQFQYRALLGFAYVEEDHQKVVGNTLPLQATDENVLHHKTADQDCGE